MKLQQNYIMTADEFINKIKKTAKCKTLYVMGAFGAPGNAKNKARYKNNHSYNRNPQRQAMIDAATADTFFMDCIGMIKGNLWGFDAKKDRVYGGAGYKANNVPDYGANSIFNSHYMQGVSKDFSVIKPGAVVHMDGHVGVYVGNGEVIECTPKWDNCVQYSNLGNNGYISGHFRVWDNYGYLPCVDYSAYEDYKEETAEEAENPIDMKLTYTVKKGDTLTKISRTFNRTIEDLVEMNKKKYSHISRNYICVGWILEV